MLGTTCSLELGRRLGVSQPTAWKMSHKLQVMYERERSQPLGGRVEMDDAYLGGKVSGGKVGAERVARFHLRRLRRRSKAMKKGILSV